MASWCTYTLTNTHTLTHHNSNSSITSALWTRGDILPNSQWTEAPGGLEFGKSFFSPSLPTVLLPPWGVEHVIFWVNKASWYSEKEGSTWHTSAEPVEQEVWWVKYKWIRNRWVRFLLKYTWVLQLGEERGCEESFGQRAAGSAGPYRTVRWTQNTARVNFYH